MRGSRCDWLCAVVLCAWLSSGWAAEPREIRAVRADPPPVLDGDLADACWQAAAPVTGFQLMGSERPAELQTIARFAYDDTNLYMAVTCLHPGPGKVRSKVRAHDDDKSYGEDDLLEIMVDPGRSRTRYVQLLVNAAGSTYDCSRGKGVAVDSAWDGLWQVAAAVDAAGWSVEIAAPFAGLDIAADTGSTWGINVCRDTPKPMVFSSMAPGGAYNRPECFPALTGLEVDFRRFAFEIGPAVPAMRRIAGKSCVVPTVPVLNRTGRPATVRIDWQSDGAEPRPGRDVTLQPDEAVQIEVEPLPLERETVGTSARLAVVGVPARVRVMVSDSARGETLRDATVVPRVRPLGLSIEVEPLYSRAAIETPPDRLAFAVHADLPAETLAAGRLVVTLSTGADSRRVFERTFEAPSARTQVVVNRADAPWGAYAVRAVFMDGQGDVALWDEKVVPVLPTGAERIRVLNNLVAELRDVRELPVGKDSIAFMNHRDGWVFFAVRGSGEISLHVDDEQRAMALGPGPSGDREAMRFLAPGRHSVRIGRGQDAVFERLVIRAVPELQYCNYPTPPIIGPFGPYDQAFLSRHVLANCNVIVGSADEANEPFMQEWTRGGKRWIMRSTLPGLNQSLPDDPDSVYQYWSTHPGYAHPLMSGIIVDEFGGNPEALYRNWTAALRRIASDPKLKGRTFYPYSGSLHGISYTRPFVETVLGNGGVIAWERYQHEAATEDEARALIEDRLISEAGAWSKAFPGALRQLLVVLGYFNTPWCSLNWYATVNFQTFLDMECHSLANDPALFGLRGFQMYLSWFADAETVNWGGRLFRHYAIEGRRDRLTRDPYMLEHIANPDFDDGVRAWTLEPAEAGSMEARTMAGYGLLQMRYPRTAQGDTFLWTRRCANRPNVFAQAIRGLQPGRLYSLKLYTADYGNLSQGVSAKETNAVTITVEGGDVQPAHSFQCPYRSHSPAGAFSGSTRAWMNYHWRVFRATAATGRLVLRDWAPDGTPGGPIGQELMFNFIELQPYTGDDDAPGTAPSADAPRAGVGTGSKDR